MKQIHGKLLTFEMADICNDQLPLSAKKFVIT